MTRTRLASRHLNLRHLHVLSEVARCGTISAAGRQIALSQPAMTQAVAALERSLGGEPLFDRTNAGMSVTAAGRQVVERVDRAIVQLREAITEAHRASPHDAATLKRIERGMTSAQLKALVAIVEQGNFSEAARAIGVSQPTLHRAARELESLVGLSLFERTSFGVQPTKEAERLARGARLAFAEIDQARAELGESGAGEDGRTVIGAMPLARSYLLPRALIEFTTEHPLHSVSILEGSFDTLISQLRSGAADFLIGALREKLSFKDVVQEHLFDDELAIIMRAGHPLAARKRASMSTLSKYPWIAPRRESPLRAHFDELFRAADVRPPTSAIECNSLIAARSLLLESDRVMLLSVHQIHYDLQAGLLAALPHPHGRVTRAIALTMRASWRPTRVQARLLEMVRERAAEVIR